jgi:hypothetical protein
MATVNCTTASLVLAQKCYSCFGQKINQAAMVYWLEQRRAKLAGTTPLTAVQLLAASRCLECFPIDPVADGLDAAVAQAGAVAAGVVGASTITISQIRANINQFANLTLDDLRSIELVTKCALNAFP